MTSKREIERRLGELEAPEEIPVMTLKKFMLFDLKRCAVEHGDLAAERGPKICNEEERIVRFNGERYRITEEIYREFDSVPSV